MFTTDTQIGCTADTRTNCLVVSAPDSAFKQIEQLLEQLDQPEQGKPKTQIFNLTYANADDLADMLEDTLPDSRIRIRAWQQANCIVVTADPAGLELVKSLISELDCSAVDVTKEKESIGIFPLDKTPDDELEDALDLAMGDNGKCAIDTTRNHVIVRGNATAMENAKQVISAFEWNEDTAPPPATVQQRVRLVWLTSEAKRLGLALPPADLKDVVDELAKLSITDLGLVSQNMVNTAGQEFTIESSPNLTSSLKLLMHGKFLGAPDSSETRQLSLSLEAIDPKLIPQPRGSRSNTLCKFESTISAPIGHSIVLGITSIESMTSVFVLQLLPAK